MTGNDLKSWRKSQGLTMQEAAAVIGISNSAYQQYEQGHRRDANKTPVEIPKPIEWACAAIAAGLTI